MYDTRYECATYSHAHVRIHTKAHRHKCAYTSWTHYIDMRIFCQNVSQLKYCICIIFHWYLLSWSAEPKSIRGYEHSRYTCPSKPEILWIFLQLSTYIIGDTNVISRFQQVIKEATWLSSSYLDKVHWCNRCIRDRGGSRKLWVGGGPVCVFKGKALDRGTKSRRGVGVGMGGGVPPPYVEENWN